MKELYRALHKTAKSAGIKVLSDDKCCQLLAWLLHFGGGQEATVFNILLNGDISEAQDRLNLHGGECANAELLPALQLYSMDAENYLTGKIMKPEWVIDIENKYNLRPYKDSRTI
jgi:hypothetical protein